MFAIVPSILLAAGVSGLFIGDPDVRKRVVDVIVQVMPPLRGLVDVVLEEAARDAGPVSLIGGVVLAWGASRFTVAFQTAFARVMGRTRTRGFVARNAIAVASVVVMVGAILLGAFLAGVSSFVDAAVQGGVFASVAPAVDLVLELVPPLLLALAVAVVFRVVPVPAASWRATALPAPVVAIALTLLARIFVFFAPRLIGAAALLGTVATVFAALAWLGLSFQAILLGASWVCERDADRAGGGPIQPS